MANYADLLAAEEKKNIKTTPSSLVEEEEPVVQPIDQSISQSTDKPVIKGAQKKPIKKTNQLVGQSTSQPISRLTNPPAYSKTVDRPKAFYITERLDRKLDEAVRYLQDTHGIKKVDRSTIINALLDNDAYWTDESLDLLVDRVISQLTSRLTGK